MFRNYASMLEKPCWYACWAIRKEMLPFRMHSAFFGTMSYPIIWTFLRFVSNKNPPVIYALELVVKQW